MDQKPSIGRIVHYHAYGTPGGEFKSVPRAAVVTDIVDEAEEIGVCVLNPSGIFFHRVKHAPGDVPLAGHWNWPPKV
jgi:hypothetical protein